MDELSPENPRARQQWALLWECTNLSAAVATPRDRALYKMMASHPTLKPSRKRSGNGIGIGIGIVSKFRMWTTANTLPDVVFVPREWNGHMKTKTLRRPGDVRLQVPLVNTGNT